MGAAVAPLFLRLGQRRISEGQRAEHGRQTRSLLRGSRATDIGSEARLRGAARSLGTCPGAGLGLGCSEPRLVFRPRSSARLRRAHGCAHAGPPGRGHLGQARRLGRRPGAAREMAALAQARSEQVRGLLLRESDALRLLSARRGRGRSVQRIGAEREVSAKVASGRHGVQAGIEEFQRQGYVLQSAPRRPREHDIEIGVQRLSRQHYGCASQRCRCNFVCGGRSTEAHAERSE
mmetsp:Transcript_168935/g.543087  ORF Transcript_168935/g.543087 Transcript_168935/m.543087 type:complete len:234 (+) Transcript_168935:43-744(+)